ncbi:hypothetical protein NQ318_015778, partial [Aromia moschata]
TLSLEEQEDYHQLVRHLEMRYGQSHLEHVYHSQLKNRCQKNNELLQMACVILRPVKLLLSLVPASWWMLWRELWNSKPLNKVAEVKLRSVRWRNMLRNAC